MPRSSLRVWCPPLGGSFGSWRYGGLRLRAHGSGGLLELLQAGVPLVAAPRVPMLAGGRIPQSGHLKTAAYRITCMVKDQKPGEIMKNYEKDAYA
jgi:hypothetical protein